MAPPRHQSTLWKMPRGSATLSEANISIAPMKTQESKDKEPQELDLTMCHPWARVLICSGLDDLGARALMKCLQESRRVELGSGLEAYFYADQMQGRAHANSVGWQALAVLRHKVHSDPGHKCGTYLCHYIHAQRYFGLCSVVKVTARSEASYFALTWEE
jgi:hypothetical protein